MNDSADPQLAATGLAQAEHDVLAHRQSFDPSKRLATLVQAAVLSQLEELGRPRSSRALANNSIVVSTAWRRPSDLANVYAPEHLYLLVHDPSGHLGESPTPATCSWASAAPRVLGDYVAPVPATMPTGGTTLRQPLNVLDFVEIVSVIGLNRLHLQIIGPAEGNLLPERVDRTCGGGRAGGFHDPEDAVRGVGRGG